MRRNNKGRCRGCGGHLFAEPLLCFANMPKAAQYMPRAATLRRDRGVALDIWQCAACGLIQVLGKPVPYYREVVRAVAFSAEMRGFRLEQFQAFIDGFGLARKKLVEIGCGRGEYLELIQACGVVAHGVEYAPAAVRHGQSHGLTVFPGFVSGPDYSLPQAPYDAFMILNFLEHHPNPRATLLGIHCNLAPGGVGLVEVPNLDMMIKKSLFSEFIRDHLLYFTEKTITQMLESAGFQVLECKPVWHDYILAATVRKRVPSDLSLLLEYQRRIHRELHCFLDRFAPRRVVVWGAGHQALAVLSLLELGERIAYVVDSAPFKQGGFTPASHLPIVAPERLHAEPPEAIIVMAASYSDEVARTIRERYDPGIQVAIVRDYGLEEWVS